MPEQEYDSLVIELCDQRDSGFVMDGTQNTPTPNRLTAPSQRFIPNRGKRLVVKKEMRGDKAVDVQVYEPIRYIKGSTIISEDEQNKAGILPATKSTEDKIIIPSGMLTIMRDPGNAGLFDYITQVFYNESAEGRSPKATAIYRILEPDKDADQENEDDIYLADTLNYLKSLSTKTKDGFKYNVEKIKGLAELFTVFAETPATKLQGLSKFAKLKPKLFIEAVTAWDNVTETQVTHAIKLNVIKIDNQNVAMYVAKDKVIKHLGSEKMSHQEKIMKLSDWLKTSDGHEAYMELTMEIDLAKSK